MTRYRKVALWIATGLLGLLMFLSGVEKFTSPQWETRFSQWGYPGSFVYVVGVLEIVFGAGIFVPRFSALSAMVLCSIVIGAIATQLSDVGYQPGTIIFHFVLMGLYLLIAYVRRPTHFRRGN